MRLDTLLLIPIETDTAAFVEPMMRKVAGAHYMLPYMKAAHDFERYVGHRLDWWRPSARPCFGGNALTFPSYRSLSAVALATSLERAGLRWEAVDPGSRELSYWRHRLRVARPKNPRTVAICSTFILSEPWIRALCVLVRRELPDTRLLIGGYYYASNARNFLSLDADVLCIGEGEERLPQIVRAIRDGEALTGIPGLYVRQPDGSIVSTGRADPRDMESLPQSDWSLVERIEPPVDIHRDEHEPGVETQRGCVFKCEFCTFRTLASLSLMSPERAADAILATRALPRGFLSLPDATGTYPHDRFDKLLSILIQRGGSPHPMQVYARVSDINQERAKLMQRAGVRHVFIGQESGDQGMLNAMKKGTRLDQVKPAIAALGRCQIKVTMSFIHGFPGETTGSIQNSRHLLATINDGFESTPVVITYFLFPFTTQEFASVSQREVLQGVDHMLGYEHGLMSATQASEELLGTIIAASRVPHAPAYIYYPPSAPSTNGVSTYTGPHRYEIHRWLKALDRGTAIFLERELEGRAPNDHELRSLRAVILQHYPHVSRWRAVAARVRARARARFMRRLIQEWRTERQQGPGIVTRTMVLLAALRDSGELRTSCSSCLAGTYRFGKTAQGQGRTVEQAQQVDHLAGQLVSEALLRKPPNLRSLAKPSDKLATPAGVIRE